MLLLLLSLLVPLAGALTITVPAGVEKCIYFKVDAASQKVFGSFQVASGGFLDIDLAVKGPSGVTGYTAVRKTNDRFAFVATEPGEWKGCFGNTMSTMSSKMVSFSFRVGEGYGDGTDVLATKQSIKPIETHVLKLAEELLSIQETQRYSNVRERAHRDSKFDNTTQRRSVVLCVLWLRGWEGGGGGGCVEEMVFIPKHSNPPNQNVTLYMYTFFTFL
jgi:hypothetical protein